MDRTGKGFGWLLGKVRKGQVWCALLSLSLSLSVAAAVEISWTDGRTQSPRLEDRAIDSALAESLPVSLVQPPSGLYSLILGSSFIVFFLILSLLNGWIDRDLDGENVDKERSGVLLLSQVSLALYALHLFAG